MLSLVREGFPFREVVRAHLFDVLLCVCAKGTIEFLSDWILDSNSFDLLVKIWEFVTPCDAVSVRALSYA